LLRAVVEVVPLAVAVALVDSVLAQDLALLLDRNTPLPLVVVALEQREPDLMALAEHLAAIPYLAPLHQLAAAAVGHLLMHRQTKLD
jgi:hypothetical protein